MPPGPPRLLLGAALLFWGAITGRLIPGIACALLIEGAHWTRVRWDFGEKAALVAWRLSVLFLVIAMTLVLLQAGPRLTTMARTFTWLPVVMMPLQFIQSYGMSRTLSLATFSMMMRRRRDHAAAHGLPFREVSFGFGHVFFCGTLLASCLGANADTPWFFGILVALVSWAVVARAGRGWKGLTAATALALILSAIAGIGGQKGLTALYMYATTGRMSQDGDAAQNARERSTSIGQLGPVKQSTEIMWRVIPEKGPLPRFLRMASYNEYVGTTWSIILPKGVGTSSKDFEDLPEIGNPANPEDPEDKFQICPPKVTNPISAIDPALTRFRLRGVIPERGGLIPLPANAASLHGLDFQELERNSFGAFMMKPSQPVSDTRVLWDDKFTTEAPPWESIDGRKAFAAKPGPGASEDQPSAVPIMRPDLKVPPRELQVLRKIVDELGLRDGTTEEKIEKLRVYFLNDFKYSRYNSVPTDLEKWARGNDKMQAWLKAERRTYLGTFLQYTRSGHCEYFATATALLLREAGVPTRYVSGFVVAEFDRSTGEALIRGTHAHAWCRAWDEDSKKWLDVDLTPPSWLGIETPRPERFQALRDKMQRVREDLLVWRDEPGHMTIIIVAFLTPILIGLSFLGRRLWRSRRQLEAAQKKKSGPVMRETPLTALEKPARKLLGERPPGLPLGPWLLQLTPKMPRPELLADALKLHHQLRFDPAQGEPGLMDELQLLVKEIRSHLAG